MSQIESNTTALQSLLAKVNALPEAGGGSVEICTVTCVGVRIWICFNENHSKYQWFSALYTTHAMNIPKNIDVLIPQTAAGFPVIISPMSNVEKLESVHIDNTYGYGDWYIVKDSITIAIDD